MSSLWRIRSLTWWINVGSRDYPDILRIKRFNLCSFCFYVVHQCSTTLSFLWSITHKDSDARGTNPNSRCDDGVIVTEWAETLTGQVKRASKENSLLRHDVRCFPAIRVRLGPPYPVFIVLETFVLGYLFCKVLGIHFIINHVPLGPRKSIFLS